MRNESTRTSAHAAKNALSKVVRPPAQAQWSTTGLACSGTAHCGMVYLVVQPAFRQWIT